MNLTRHVPLRRRMPTHKLPQRDPVTASERAYVLGRDKACVAAILGFEHVCRDRFGVPHLPTIVPLLSIEHVKDQLAMGMRAPSDRRHLVAVCYCINLRPPSKEMRAAFRDYIERVEAVPHG